ncbi:MAG: neutral/alkaline non-lysosomal ceramidase N-terminal domain-containing protein [Planctomycetota bacterium]|nr:neutral/alkaline non-lysosomal ceramidase N-terminal domain-containing protein [Planctomycetota bacterium]
MRTHQALRLALIAAVGLCACSMSRAALRAGCAKVDITPPLGLKLIGSQGKPSDSVLDELYGRALVLSDGANTVAIVSVDLLYSPLEEITNPVRALVAERVGIPGQNVMVCATHTHSGPDIFTNGKLPLESRIAPEDIDPAYVRTVIGKLASVVQMAHRDMQDAKIGVATGALPEVAYNRRPKRPNGQVQTTFTLPAEIAATRRVEARADGRTIVTFTMPPEQADLTFGPIDPAVSVLRVEDPNGQIIGSLFAFGCHPVSVYPFRSTAISADYPAHALRVVERTEGGVSLFALGLAGNVVPIRRDVGPCEQIGKALGAEALRRLQLIPIRPGRITLAARCGALTLATKDTPPQEITTEIQVLRLGDVYLLGLPGEILVEVGLAIKDQASLDKLFITTLTNDSIGYVCHAQAYTEAGYESTRGTHLAPGAGERLIADALNLLDEIKP